MFLSVKGTKYKSIQEASNQRTLRLMNPVRVQKVGHSSEGSRQFRRFYGYQEQAQKFMNIIKNIQGSRDINKNPENYIDLDQSKNKGNYLD